MPCSWADMVKAVRRSEKSKRVKLKMGMEKLRSLWSRSIDGLSGAAGSGGAESKGSSDGSGKGSSKLDE